MIQRQPKRIRGERKVINKGNLCIGREKKTKGKAIYVLHEKADMDTTFLPV